MAGLITINYCASKLIKKISIKFHKNKYMRRLGMKYGNGKLYDPLNSLFMEGYYELMLAIALETVAFKRYTLAYFFNLVDD